MMFDFDSSAASHDYYYLFVVVYCCCCDGDHHSYSKWVMSLYHLLPPMTPSHRSSLGFDWWCGSIIAVDLVGYRCSID
jgi:hypothetical protein